MISLIEPHQGTQVLGHVDHIRSFACRDNCTASIEYVSLIGLRNHGSQVSGVLARFRDIDFNGFGKEIEEHTIQQGSVRVNNGMQQDIGELAAHSCPLERKGNQAWNVEENPQRLAIFPGNPSTDSVKEGPETAEFSPRLTPWEGIQPKIVIHHLKPPEFTPRTGIQPNRINIPLESK
ncbi:hypothetical protein R3P38DRAFT_2806114 [Favolaschia claudopus]|uniref:Uncharacterized protein n=1 Tax=Favolaschia claudopus TaxID=2862362 RepID=A0AAV9ZKN2_9AGAR